MPLIKFFIILTTIIPGWLAWTLSGGDRTAAAPSPLPESTASSSQNIVPAKDYQILIMGTIISQNKKVALIKELESKKVKALRVDDSLLDKHRIVDIKKNYLTIKDQARTVMLLKNQFADQSLATNHSLNRQSSSSNLNYREDGLNRVTSSDEIDIKITGAYRDNIIQNDLQKILMEAAATPKTKNNKIVGFVLTDITPGSIFEKAGFSNGDLIQSINSTLLNSPSTAIKILHSLKQETAVDVALIRDGAEMNMTISVN